jgi:energy-coupling factor transporter ATP-binding protein EcfA2
MTLQVVELLLQVKRHCTLLVVSHDLRELAPLVDVAWRMRMGGSMEAVAWPPGSLTDLEEEGRGSGGRGDGDGGADGDGAGGAALSL